MFFAVLSTILPPLRLEFLFEREDESTRRKVRGQLHKIGAVKKNMADNLPG